ncbi:MAG: M48 family metalloprotease [Desulfobulbus sp.]|nr:M48 family metalloprotease [Desulfobulbus sp.]
MVRKICFVRCAALLALTSFLMLPLQALALTIGEERKIGEQLLYSMRKELPILDDPDISQYINTLGSKVLKTVGPQYFDYRFYVVKSKQFNAFAAPAGLVFFYSGLIETVKNEDQLLSVLAHEIGHVVSRHIAQRMEKNTVIGAASLLLAIAGLAIGVPGLSPGIMMGSMAAGQAANLQYSREDEEQADRLSYGWMKRMHRNPEAMEGMLQSMRRITRYRIGGDTPQYLLTHPNPEVRLGYIESMLEGDRRKGKQQSFEKTDNFDFIRFKYRVLFQAIDPEKLKIYCITLLNAQDDPEQQIMANFGMAQLAADARDFDGALTYLDKVQGHYPKKNILNVDRAVIVLENGRYDEARFLLERAVRQDPNEMYGLYQLAKLESMRGNIGRAEQLLQRLAVVMPEYPPLYFELGRIEANRGREGMAGFYLSKYNLYLGRVKLAKQYLSWASKDTSLQEKYRNEARALLDKLKELEKGI